jgi:hypothetical protein
MLRLAWRRGKDIEEFPVLVIDFENRSQITHLGRTTLEFAIQKKKK